MSNNFQKRRSVPEPPSANDIAQSNATLQYIIGDRTNRWNQYRTAGNGETGYPLPQATPYPPAAVSMGAYPGPMQANAPSATAAPPKRMRPPRPHYEPDQSYQDAFNQRFPVPERYRLPSNASNQSSIAGPSGNDPRNVSLFQAGLPSPALSDDPNRSPVQSAYPVPDGNAATQPIPNYHPYSRPRLTSATTAVGPPQHAQITPQQTYPRSMYGVSGQTANQQSNRASNRPTNPPPSTLPANIHPFRSSPQNILNQIANLQSSTLTSTNQSRLLLLRDAVLAGDGFCLVLCQIHCNSFVDPNSLPLPFNRFDPSVYRYLDLLLGKLDYATPEFGLLQVLSSFPEPVANLQPELLVLRAVSGFLHNFNKNWEPFRDLCLKLHAPPLVQDIVDSLGVQSNVIQTTIFRAILRSLSYKLTQNKGMNILERLHRSDQRNYDLGHRHNPREKGELYDYLERLVSGLIRWEEISIDNPNAASIPLEISELMSNRPRSVRTVDTLQPMQVQVNDRTLPPQPLQQVQVNNRTLPPQPSQQVHMISHNSPQGPLPNTLNSPLTSNTIVPSLPPNTIHPTTRPPSTMTNRVFPYLHETPRPQPTHPDPNRSALHQVHLRSPIMKAMDEKDVDLSLMYRHVVGFILPPTLVDMSVPVQTVSFPVSAKAVSALPTITLSDDSESQISVQEGTQAYRVRCALMPASGIPSVSAWVTTDGYWPDNMYLKFNDKILETRRKLHHGRYLPIDITHKIEKGQNRLQVTLNRKIQGFQEPQYVVAIETVEYVTRQSIVNSIKTISAEESLNAIKKSLAGDVIPGHDNDDDEIAVTSSSLTINLFDPYANCKIFQTPVRGSTCLHRDCFDLDTFLDLCKRPSPDQPTVVDCWRCPFCRGDVRPSNLVVDEFLVDVRAELACRDQLGTRAIVIGVDGIWKPKMEKGTGVRSSSLDLPAVPVATERDVIELD